MKVKCKFCGKLDKNYNGYCQQCYGYFIRNNFVLFKNVEYGKLNFVEDKDSPQYGMPICHICKRAYIKLQSHIYNTHNMTKNEYCDKFGLDRGIKMTTKTYQQMMRDYAYKYNMDEQVKRVGMKTRFKKGCNNKYQRSYMTIERLKHYGVEMGYKNLKNNKEGN